MHVYGLSVNLNYSNIKLFEDESEPAYQDVKVIAHFIKQLLCIDWDKQIISSQALKHPFITTSHLNDYK